MIQQTASLTGDAIVRLIDLNKSFGERAVLRGISLDFPRGKTTVVLGPSGCGKSVMLKHLIGLLRPDSGEVWFEQERVDTMPERALGPIRCQFGFLFQQGALFDSMTVRENIAFPLVEHADLSGAQIERRVRRVLRLVSLQEAIDQMPANLSGGQLKRVALARAIVLEPKVVLYDEPTTGLDPIRADSINELIIKLQRELSITSIVVTHDLHSAFRVADRMIMMHDGQVRLNADPGDFKASSDPVVKQFLMGESLEGHLQMDHELETMGSPQV